MDAPLTVEQRGYPLLVRAANAALSGADSVGMPLPALDEEALLHDARQRTGLDDFGDPAFLDGMRHVVANARRLGFTPLARQIVRGAFLQALSNRLILREQWSSRPELAQVEVTRPIFVLGFPRTGTTLLQHLLALGEGRRGVPFWELLTPCPVHDDPRTDIARRQRRARVATRLTNLIAPEAREVHEVRHDTLEECWYLFCNTFRVLNWDLVTGMRSYGEWLLSDADMVSAYREYKQYLQMFVARRPSERLVLKCPEHLWFIDELLEVFPDACIVWTHRDPAASVASYGSLLALTRRLLYGDFDPAAMGPYTEQRFLQGVTRAMAARERSGREDAFYDVDFERLVTDPAAVVRDIHTHFDLDWSDDVPARIQRWQEADRADKRGAHRYSAQAFNVQPDAVRRAFAPYIERFDVAASPTR